MKRIAIVVGFLLAVAVTLPLLGKLAHRRALAVGSPHKIYVVLGFHTNFYHSWRGDTPDEAGFGTDIRIVREILRILDQANAEGLDARSYWESDNQFTLESILPQHAPDILEGIRRRVQAGHDEVLVAPYNNGFFSAMTEDEARAALRWAVHNPWGSGVGDLFGSYVPIVRPQEGMFTPGLIPLLEQEGMQGLILAYSTFPFTTFSNFVEPLSVAQRHGLTWLRTEPDGPRIKLFPCTSLGDVIDFVSLEKWMLELRELQVDGSVDHDLVIHINFDADAESWLPFDLPMGLNWLPNTGGLREYIDAVNKYDWAEFSTPGRYMESHEPVGEVVVRQDTADGAWDGYYSWSEKLGSQELWTKLEQSRLFEAQARTVGGQPAPDPRMSFERSDRDASFYQRIRALSTTHFGMSTPMVNEERYAAASDAVERSRSRALAELQGAAAERAASAAPPDDPDRLLYSFEAHALEGSFPAGVPLRIPLTLPWPAPVLHLVDGAGSTLPYSLIDVAPTGSGQAAAEIVVLPPSTAVSPLRLDLFEAGLPPSLVAAAPPSSALRLDNGRVQLALSATNGVDSILLDGVAVGGPEFLSSFVTYRTDDVPETYWASDWIVEVPAYERLDGIQRARLSTQVPVQTPAGKVRAGVTVDFLLPDAAPFVIADVAVDYPYTEKRNVVATPQQKLRMLTDSRWIEVAPFQLQPQLQNSSGEFLHVWRRNFLGTVASFPLDYGRINPKNAQLDSFNHHVTSAWVAVADGRRGLLIAPDATVRSSANFAPMRLREEHGRQRLTINPFGSYYGEQMDYSHLGGSGLGTELTVLIGAAFRPNGPSFNGKQQRFSLLLAPYAGDRPPAPLEAAAEAFYHPPALVVLHAADGIDGHLGSDIAAHNARQQQVARADMPPEAPRAFLASPTLGALDLVWDAPPSGSGLTYEVAWRSAPHGAWQSRDIGTAHRHRLADLSDGTTVEVRVRAVARDRVSDWSETASVVVGPVGEQSVLDFAAEIPPGFVARLLHQSLQHVLTVP